MHRTDRVPRLAAALPLLLALVGCPDAPLLSDHWDAAGPGDVDMLWVIDNSESMADAQLQLTENFHAFVNALPDTSTTRMGITTTQAWPCAEDEHPMCDDEAGTSGRLRQLGGSPALLDPASAADQELFQQLAHVGVHGSGFERATQAALMAVCAATPLPEASDFVPGTDDLREDFPEGCSGDEWDPSHELYDACHCLPREVQDDGPEILHGANVGLLRGDNPLHVVVLTDEGDDTSSLEALGDGACDDLEGEAICDCRLERMLALLRDVVSDVRVSVIGPGQGPFSAPEQRYLCNPMGSTACALEFYFDAVDRTDGLFAPILDPVDLAMECQPAELATALSDLVLFHPSIEWFELSVVPDLATLTVRKNDDEMPHYTEGGSCNPDAPSTGGWVYEPTFRAVSLVGDCTAFPGDTVSVTYESAGPLLVL